MAYYETVEVTWKAFGTTIKEEYRIQETEAGKAIATGQSFEIELKADDIITAKKQLLKQLITKFELSIRTVP